VHAPLVRATGTTLLESPRAPPYGRGLTGSLSATIEGAQE
jgi:hypothetical protein